MRITFGFILTLLILSSCGDEPKETKPKVDDEVMTDVDSLDAEMDSLDIKSEYDMTTVDAKDRKEFIKILKKIEDKYGTQWDFCTCVVKQDSVVKAFDNPDLSDEGMDKLISRSDMIDEKCKAFLSQSASQTPDDRANHEDKVRKCLKAAGISM